MKGLLKDLVHFRSYEPAEINACVDYIHNYLKHHKVPCEVIENEGLKILVSQIGKGEKCLILNAHIDVVKSPPEAFRLREEGDRLIGPGIFDMKGSAAALMEILSEINPKELKSRVMVQFVPDEEVGGANGTGYLAKKGYQGDFFVACEPTHLNISIQCKGAFFLKVEVPGKAAHGSRPWLGDNAILKSFRIYEDLQKIPFLKASSKFFRCATANLTKIEGGDSLNKVPDRCTMYLDVRYLPGQSYEEVLGQIDAVLQRHGARHEVIRQAAPVLAPEDHPVVKSLLQICKRHDPEIRLIGQDGSSDAKYYAPLGVPGIEFGPAGGGQHSADEFIDYPKLVTYKEILKDLILSFE